VRDLAGKSIILGLVDTHSHIGIYPRPHVPANGATLHCGRSVRPCRSASRRRCKCGRRGMRRVPPQARALRSPGRLPRTRT
jgi:hypothetical protein